MLILSRKRDQVVELGPIPPEAVGQVVRVVVVDVPRRGVGVRLGLETEDEAIPIWRGEATCRDRERRTRRVEV